MKVSNWILLLPFLVFGTGVGLFVQTENEARVLFERAKQAWRGADYQKAAQIYRSVQSEHPESSYAALALWELAQLNYVNRYDIEAAIEAASTLTQQRPDSPLAPSCFLMLADIHEKELQDLEGAIHHWQAFLDSDPPALMEQPVLFRMGDAYFKLGRFGQALQTFEMLLQMELDDQLFQLAHLRVGTIFQIMEDYEGSLGHFRAVLEREKCRDCRLQAQLALIESYEFLDELSSAIEVARSIGEGDYPIELKAGLLARLSQKQTL